MVSGCPPTKWYMPSKEKTSLWSLSELKLLAIIKLYSTAAIHISSFLVTFVPREEGFSKGVGSSLLPCAGHNTQESLKNMLNFIPGANPVVARLT